MPKYGLLIHYDFCIGCHVCEIACQREHNRPVGEEGIHVMEVQPETSGGKLYYFPFPTDHCNFCGKRTARGVEPACVKHCQSGVMRFGKIKDLTKKMEELPRSVLWAPH
jgi:Fe-S-cluster-containing dehydrogenase component